MRRTSLTGLLGLILVALALYGCGGSSSGSPGGGSTGSGTKGGGGGGTNTAPIANTGSDQTVNAGDTVLLNGAASTDPAGGTLAYAWSQVSGPTVTLAGADAVQASFTAPSIVGGTTLVFGLTVTDTAGLTGTAQVTVHVNDPSVSGSGGGTASDPLAGPVPTPGGTPVSTADKWAVITAAEQQWQTLVDTVPDRAAREQQMADFLTAQPAIKSAGVGTFGDVVAQFQDNQYYLISDGDTVKAPPLPRSPAGAQRVAPTPRIAASTTPVSGVGEGDMPASKQARIVDGMGPGFPTANGLIDEMLSDRGYDVTEERATVENLRSISGDGVFYLYTHGSLGYDPATKATWWSLWTDTKATDANYAQYKADLDDYSLIYVTGAADWENGEEIVETHYGITANFIQKYHWSFADNAVAFINACYSMASGAAQAMAQIPNGATEVFGWSNTMWTDPGMEDAEFIFDRMLGENTISPEQPAQRPFSGYEAWDDAYKHTNSLGIAYGAASPDPDHISVLGEAHLGHDVVLATSIERMEMSERIQEDPLLGDTRLTLYGLFGDQEGTVTIGSVEVPVVHWAKDKVVCQPADVPGPGFSGDVQAVSLDRTGNLVPLTQWHGSVGYSVYMYPPPAPPITSQVQCDVYFRGDVHQYREHAHDPMHDPQPMAFRASQGSSCHWQVIGGPPEGAYVRPTSADLPFGLNGLVNPPEGTGYIFSGVVTAPSWGLDALVPSPGKVAMSFDFLDCTTAYQEPPAPVIDLPTFRDDALLDAATGVGPDGYMIFANSLQDTIGSDYLIPAKTFPSQIPMLDPELVLGDFIPSAAPDPAKGEDQR